MKKLRFSIAFVLTFVFMLSITIAQAQHTFYVDASTTFVLPSYLNPIPVGGDTIKIRAGRTETLQFRDFKGNENNPIVFINDGGQVHINTNEWGALRFFNCKYIKVSGTGDSNFHYGFKLQGLTSGLSFEDLSSDCEVEFTEVAGFPTTFFGIFAKKDYAGNPPIPYPIFNKLSIHDNYIHDVAEGMYIGETTSPGMEFHHLRIYNNVVINTLRESAQIANSVEDVEIYNNFFLDAGLANLTYQNNGLQIGTNTTANVYNNAIINTNEYGIIVLANGDVSIKNNYIKNSKGLFNDYRFTIHPFSFTRIEGNFFDLVNNTQVIDNFNEYNDLFISNNSFSPDILFFKNSATPEGLITVVNNQFSAIPNFQYTLENGIFQNSTANPLAYQAMGPKSGLGQVYNDAPILQPIDNIIVDDSTSTLININATVGDLDILHFETRNLPSFVQLVENASGQAEIIINPLFKDVGIYEFSIMVYDESHHAYDRQKVQLSVMNPDNHAPVLNFDKNLSVEAASKFQLDITAFDLDNDSLTYSLNSAPAFAKIVLGNGQVFLDLQPKISDSGQYAIQIIADDGYGLSVIRELNLNITPIELFENRVLYRINVGGPELEDEPINWEVDLANSVPVYGTTFFLRTGSWSWTGVNNTSAPNNLFGPFRYDAAGGTEMQYEFPLPANGRYKVKLFFAKRSTEVNANLTATFNVFIESAKILDAFNIYQNTQYEALEKSFDVAIEEQVLNLDFQQVENNAKINGIEISYLGKLITNQPPEIQALTPVVMKENEILEIPIPILDDHFASCNSLDLSVINAPDYLSITQDSLGLYIHIQPGFEDSGLIENTILIASDGCLADSLPISITVLNTNRPPVFNSVGDIELQAGKTLNLAIQASDADNDILTLQLLNAPAFIALTDTANGNGNLLISPAYNDTGDYSGELMVEDENGGSSSLILNFHIFAPAESKRIILNRNMITDLVVGGSRLSPNHLVDEQNKDPFLNIHPRSKNWVPSKRIKDSPYMTQIDLGQDYFIDFAIVHDMKFTDDLHFSIGSPNRWTEIASYNTSSFKRWSEVNIQANSRYLLLSMYNTVSAQINELALYGYALNPTQKSARVETQALDSKEFEIYPNPAKDRIYIKNKTEKQTVEILDINGKTLLRSQENSIKMNFLPSGIYLIRIYELENVVYQSRFIKN